MLRPGLCNSIWLPSLTLDIRTINLVALSCVFVCVMVVLFA